MIIPFAKMSGAGNTFVLIDNRQQLVEQALADAELSLDRFVLHFCSPVYGAATDGLILVEHAAEHDFAWRFFNADGSHANMCGNGARCAARFAEMVGAGGAEQAFETGAGIIHATVAGDRVRVDLTAPGPVTLGIELKLDGQRLTCHQVDTGVPHLVLPVPSVRGVDIDRLGRAARFDKRFAPEGTNVNFASLDDDGTLRVRTYERGVEGETLACGTGVTAAAIVFSELNLTASPVTVMPLSGEALTVRFDGAEGDYRNASITGPARVLFRGQMETEALG